MALALLIAVIGITRAMIDTSQPLFREDRSTWIFYFRGFWRGLSADWPRFIANIAAALEITFWPLFGALLLHRLDKLLSKEKGLPLRPG